MIILKIWEHVRKYVLIDETEHEEKLLEFYLHNDPVVTNTRYKLSKDGSPKRHSA